MDAIKTVKLVKQYADITAVNGLDLTVKEGEIFSLLGLNGAGKTTTVKILCCLTPPTSGEAYLFGKSVGNNEEVKKLVDVSMQETAIAKKLTVEENLNFYADLNLIPKEEKEKRIKEVKEIFGFDKILKKRADKLSGGWQRKLSISLAVIRRPRLLFLDEPTLGLDVIARRELWTIIRKLKDQTTVVFTTHYMEEAEALSDRIGIMKDGNLVFTGSKEELFKATGKTSVENAFISIVTEGKDE